MRFAGLSWEAPIKADQARRRDAALTGADLLVLTPWLFFGAGLAAIGYGLLGRRRAAGRCASRRRGVSRRAPGRRALRHRGSMR
jgi:hypothetical protein